MATGTGLPLPNDQPVLAQAPGGVSGSALFSAQAWSQIAATGDKLAKIGADSLHLAEFQARAAAVADLEVKHRDWYVRANDEFYGRPAEFEAAAKAHNDGALAEMDPGLITHAKKYLGGLATSGLASQLAVKRSKDQQLETESLNARLKTADNDVQSLASAGKLGDQEGLAAVATYNSVLDTAVQTRAMSPDKAALLRDDLTERAQGAAIRNGLEKVYAEKGFDEARKWLSNAIVEHGVEYKMSDRLLRGGLAWLRSEESAHRGERDAISREWATAKSQASTLPNDVMVDMAQRAYGVGNIRVAQDIEATARGLEIAKQWRGLGAADRAALATTGELPADDLEHRLINRESSKRPNLVNQFGFAGFYQFGAPRLADLGLYSPGDNENLSIWSKSGRYSGGKWTGTFTIPGHPEVKTLDDFMHSPAAQQAAYEAHSARMDREITSAGLDKYEGQTVGGVTVTRDGLKAGIHLAGVGGVKATLESGGAVNPKDANGTSVLDYLKLGVGTSATGQKFTDSRAGLMALRQLKAEMGNDISHSITDLEAAIRRTEFPSLDEIYALGVQAAAVGSEDQKRRVAEIAATADAGARFQTMGPPQRAAAIDEWTKRLEAGAPEFSRKLGEVLRSSDKKIMDAYKTDPYGALYRFGAGGTELQPIDFTRADLADTLKAKISQQNTIRADQNLPAFSVLRPTEAGALAAQLTQGPVAGAANALNALGTLPRDMFIATMSDKTVAEALGGMVRSYNPDRLNAGMIALDRAFRYDPVGFATTFGGDTLKQLQVWQGLRTSMSPAEITEVFKRADDPAFATARKALTEEAGKETTSVSPANIAKAIYQSDHGFLGSLPFTGPSAPVDGLQAAAIKAEYDSIYTSFRTVGLPAAKAHDQAITRLKTTWGASAVNGDQIMRLPPEAYYGEVDGSRDWMKAAIDRDLRGVVKEPRYTKAPGDLGPTTTENWSYRLLADPGTEADIAAKRPPSYVVNIIHRDGRMEIPTDSTGAPMRYWWDDKAALEESRSSFKRLRFMKLNETPGAGGIEARQILDPFAEVGPR